MVDERLNAWETLFQLALEILDSAPRAGSMLDEWSFGGGTVLMRRYHHRLSTDIDIFLPDPQLIGHLSPRLNPAVESLTHDYDERSNFLKLYFAQGEIDFVVSGFLTAGPVTTVRIHGRERSPGFWILHRASSGPGASSCSNSYSIRKKRSAKISPLWTCSSTGQASSNVSTPSEKR